jgi:hypothetical protein
MRGFFSECRDESKDRDYYRSLASQALTVLHKNGTKLGDSRICILRVYAHITLSVYFVLIY